MWGTYLALVRKSVWCETTNVKNPCWVTWTMHVNWGMRNDESVMRPTPPALHHSNWAIVRYVQTTLYNFPHSRTKHELWLCDVSLCSCSNAQQITTAWIFVASVIHTNDDPPYSLHISHRLNTKHEMFVEMQWNNEWKCNFYDGLNKNLTSLFS